MSFRFVVTGTGQRPGMTELECNRSSCGSILPDVTPDVTWTVCHKPDSNLTATVHVKEQDT